MGLAQFEALPQQQCDGALPRPCIVHKHSEPRGDGPIREKIKDCRA